jgi:hypothetical protein
VHLFATTGERVLVLGATGALGSLTARAFQDAGWEVLRGGRRTGRDGDWRPIDLDRSATIGPAFADVDMIVNTVPHAALAAERFVIEHGGVLLNTSALTIAHGRRLGEPCAPGAGTVVLGAGMAPGMTSLVAAQLLTRHPDADEVEVVFTFSLAATSGPAGSEFVYRHLFGGPKHETVEVPLPDPFGRRRCLGFAEGERAWIGDLAGARTVRSYACFAEGDVHDALLAGNEHGTTPGLPRPPFARPPVHHQMPASREPVAHWVAVRRGGKRLAAATIRCRGDYLGAAQATLALAHVLQDARARGRLPRGVFGIEGLVALDDVEQYLGPGISIVAQAV